MLLSFKLLLTQNCLFGLSGSVEISFPATSVLFLAFCPSSPEKQASVWRRARPSNTDLVDCLISISVYVVNIFAHIWPNWLFGYAANHCLLIWMLKWTLFTCICPMRMWQESSAKVNSETKLGSLTSSVYIYTIFYTVFCYFLHSNQER